MRIIGPPSATQTNVLNILTADMNAHGRFTKEMFWPLWDAAALYGLDPVGLVAQAYKETGGGNFGGNVKPEHYNTAGIKIAHLGLYPEASGDQPLAHQMFANWDNGARAHAQHLRAYAGWFIPGAADIVDPRYSLVAGKYKCENFEELSGRWAPSATYGQELVAIARRLQGAL